MDMQSQSVLSGSTYLLYNHSGSNGLHAKRGTDSVGGKAHANPADHDNPGATFSAFLSAAAAMENPGPRCIHNPARRPHREAMR